MNVTIISARQCGKTASQTILLNKMTNRKKYSLTRDNDCHWYLIPVENQDDWEAWLDIDSDDEASWNVPDFAEAVDGPHSVEFYLD